MIKSFLIKMIIDFMILIKNFYSFSIIAFCSVNICKNDGICYINFGRKHCVCRDFQYYGRFCEKTFDHCFNLSSLCQNNGICENIPRNETINNKTYTCICPNSHFGDHCENSKFSA
jgi:hypothetical protein